MKIGDLTNFNLIRTTVKETSVKQSRVDIPLKKSKKIRKNVSTNLQKNSQISSQFKKSVLAPGTKETGNSKLNKNEEKNPQKIHTLLNYFESQSKDKFHESYQNKIQTSFMSPGKIQSTTSTGNKI